MTSYEYIMEIVLCVLLVFGIVYSIHLGRALTILKRDRKDLADLVSRLDESGRRAEDGVEKLRTAGDVSGRSLSRMIDQSKLLQGELEVLAERADALAGRLETLIRENRQTAGATMADATGMEEPQSAAVMTAADKRPSLPSLPASPVVTGGRPYDQSRRQRTEAEQDLIRALRMS